MLALNQSRKQTIQVSFWNRVEYVARIFHLMGAEGDIKAFVDQELSPIPFTRSVELEDFMSEIRTRTDRLHKIEGIEGRFFHFAHFLTHACARRP